MINSLLEFAQLADAAYVNNLGMRPWGDEIVEALAGRLSDIEGDVLRTSYSDIRSFNGPAGLSMTLFIREGKTILAFRGTQDAKDVFADILISTGVGASLNPQYVAAKVQIDKWIADGVIQGDFSVTGTPLAVTSRPQSKSPTQPKSLKHTSLMHQALEVSLGL